MINIQAITMRQGESELYSNASFQINAGEKVGLVGPNGVGKTTMFGLITGELRPDAGQVSLDKNCRLGYFSQKVGEMRGRSVLEEVMAASEELARLTLELRSIEEKLADPELDPDKMNDMLERMGEVQTEFEKLGGYDLETRAQTILTGLGIEPIQHHELVDTFSGGWKMRIALAKVLLLNPDVILLDEPTNYLDLETILWLEEWLKNFKGSLLMTSHDRDFMNKVVKKIVELSPSGATSFTGNYDYYEKEKEIRKDQNQAEFERQQAMLKKEEEFIAKFKARASHAAQVQSRVKKLEKIDRVELEGEQEQMSIMLPEIARGGNDVVVLNQLGHTYETAKGPLEVFKNLNFTIARGEKYAVVGVNGAGKSTLLKAIIGKINPTQGEAKLGPSINAGYFGQYSFENLSMEVSVFDQVKSLLPNKSDGFLRNLLAAFLFKGDDVFKKVKVLSGGEKSRVILAGLLSLSHNLLILDEPTNHLDIKSREVLLDALKRYEGTILFVSHDRHFTKELASKVIEVDKGKVELYPGNYTEYLESKKP